MLQYLLLQELLALCRLVSLSRTFFNWRSQRLEMALRRSDAFDESEGLIIPSESESDRDVFVLRPGHQTNRRMDSRTPFNSPLARSSPFLSTDRVRSVPAPLEHRRLFQPSLGTPSAKSGRLIALLSGQLLRMSWTSLGCKNTKPMLPRSLHLFVQLCGLLEDWQDLGPPDKNIVLDSKLLLPWLVNCEFDGLARQWHHLKKRLLRWYTMSFAFVRAQRHKLWGAASSPSQSGSSTSCAGLTFVVRRIVQNLPWPKHNKPPGKRLWPEAKKARSRVFCTPMDANLCPRCCLKFEQFQECQ